MKVLKEIKERVSMAVPPRKNLSAEDVDLLADDEVQSLPTKKSKLVL